MVCKSTRMKIKWSLTDSMTSWGGGKKTFLLIFKCPCERSPRVERYQRIHIYFFDHDQTACDPFAAHNVIITRANLSI